MESTLRNLYIKEETHGFTVQRHLNWDDYNWVAITPVGSVVIFRDRTDWTLYAVYNSHRGRYHVHIPYGDVVTLDKRAEEVLKCGPRPNGTKRLSNNWFILYTILYSFTVLSI